MPMTETPPSPEFAGRIAANKDWREIVAWVGDLPPMPHVASRAIQMVENPDCTAPELAKLLSSDSALAARVLKIANSAMFSRQREITTLNQAIMIIGFKALKGIVVAASLRQMSGRAAATAAIEKLVWENSMCSAMVSTSIAKLLRKRYIEEIFLLGLLHSLGQVVLLAQPETAKDYPKLVKLIEERHVDYVSLEQEIFGFTHALIGALVAKKWNFSAETCQVILHYKDPIETPRPEDEASEKTAVVQLADLISHAAGIGNPSGYPDERAAMERLAKYVGFDPTTLTATLDQLIADSREQFQKEAHIYE